MIVNILLKILYETIWVLIYPIRILSDVSLSGDLISAISTANTYISAIDFVFPVTTFLAILGLVLTIEGLIILYKSIMWLIRKIPTIS